LITEKSGMLISRPTTERYAVCAYRSIGIFNK
jgi:hypothetical protein